MNTYFKRLTNMLDCYYQSQGRKSHEGHIEDRVIKYLCKESDEFRKIMKERKLEKLSGEDFSYLISTFENKHELADEILKGQLFNKMEIIEANQNREKAIYPDIDSLYVKLNKATGGCGLFTYLLRSLKDTNYIAAKKYEELVDVLVSAEGDVLENINFYALPYTNNFAFFTPEYLKLLLDYDCEIQLKNVVFNEIMNMDGKVVEKINNLGGNEFLKALNFMMNLSSFPSRIHIIEMLLEKNMCHPFILSKINVFPKKLIEYLGKTENVDEKTKENQKRLLEDMCWMEQEEYEAILCTSKEQDSNLLELLVNDQFRKFGMETRAFLLKKLAYLDGDSQEKNQTRYHMKAQFLVGDEEKPGFLTKINPSYFVETFQFIQKERNIEVLDMKFLVLNRLRKQIEKKSLSAQTYSRYLKSLENSISGLDPKNQIKYLDSHSRYFKKHSLEEFVEQINSTRHKEELIAAMSENKKYKNLKYSYKLVDFIERYSTMDLYDPRVASKIIEQMSNCQTHEGREKIYNRVNSSTFYEASIDRQDTILDDDLPGYPMMLESMDVLDMQVLIPDYSHAQSVLEEKSEITFHDKDTKIRIKLMRKDKST